MQVTGHFFYSQNQDADQMVIWLLQLHIMSAGRLLYRVKSKLLSSLDTYNRANSLNWFEKQIKLLICGIIQSSMIIQNFLHQTNH